MASARPFSRQFQRHPTSRPASREWDLTLLPGLFEKDPLILLRPSAKRRYDYPRSNTSTAEEESSQLSSVKISLGNHC
jgi:hypothetical protein